MFMRNLNAIRMNMRIYGTGKSKSEDKGPPREVEKGLNLEIGTTIG